MIARLLATIALLAAATCVSAPSGDALARATRSLQLGNGAYEKRDWAKAAELYGKAIDEGVVNARLYYNYGNSLFRLNRLGPAILYYEKARKLDPTDADIAYNLRFAASRRADKIPEPEANALTRVLWFAHSSYSINAGLWICLGLFASAFLAAGAALFAGNGTRGLLYVILFACGIGLLAIAPSLAYKIRQQERSQFGIVLKPTVEMYSGPGESYQVLSKVHEGTKLEIVGAHGDWLSVKLPDGKGGFVRLPDLGKV